jgi:putative acetyltransferase
MFVTSRQEEPEEPLTIRDERTGDEHEVDQIVTAAFSNHPHSDQRGGWIVRRLRAGKALTMSMVADENGQLVVHVAFSPVQIDGASAGWHDLGPVAVRPEWQRQGIGSALIRAGI